ncbi:MAG: hypothetical protein ACHQQS_00065 [Thermoanaerobaculales bacterium]
MLPSMLLAAVAAVLCPGQVVLVDVPTARVIGRIALPGKGVALFAAPDGRLLVPLEDADATLVLQRTGVVERWRGRLFPLFFDQPDHMHVLLPDLLLTLSYPERLPLTRIPIAGLGAAQRAAVTRDGRVVAIVPAASGAASLVIAVATEGGSAARVALGGDARLLALAEDGALAVVVTGQGQLEIAVAGENRSLGKRSLAGTVTALAMTGRRELVVGVAGGGGDALVGMKVDPRARLPLKPRFRTPLPAAPTAFAVTQDEVLAIAADQLIILVKRGRRVRQALPASGAFDVVLLPERPASSVPAWSDATPH